MNTSKYPLVSVACFTYKQEQYISETIEGLLSQDYPNLEIVISDDKSPDNTYAIIEDAYNKYNGPHRLVINRNNENMGIAGHVNHVIQDLCHGDIIFLHGGDDISLPNRVTVSVDAMLKANVDSMTFNMYTIDENSNHTGFFYEERGTDTIKYSIYDFFNTSFKSAGASRIITRRIYDFFGPLNDDCQTEDSTLLFRSFLLGGIAYCPVPVLKYRIHSNNISGIDSLMKRIDPVKIYTQYARDLAIAKDKKAISSDEFKLLKKHIDNYKKINVAIRKIYKQNSQLMRYMKAMSYLFVPHFSPREVARFLLQVRGWGVDS